MEELAREIKFIKRKREFSGSDLATLCIWVSQRTANDSLVRLCSQLHAATGNLLGINKHFSQKAVVFLKSIFSVLWKSKLCETSAISSMTIQYFQRVRVLDVIIFQVPKYLASTYPGSGGCTQTASIKIQLEYDLHSGQFLNLQIGAVQVKNNDKTFGTECLDTLRSGDLRIRDLSYFSLEGFEQMDQRSTY